MQEDRALEPQEGTEVSRELASTGRHLPVRAEEPILVVERRRGPHPAIVLGLGMLLGIGGTAAFMSNRTERGQLVARANGPARVANPVTPRIGAQSLNPEGPAAPMPTQVPNGITPEMGTASPQDPGAALNGGAPNGAAPADPFEGMVLPTLPVPKGGTSSNPFRGMILPRQLPTAPPPSSNPPAVDGPPSQSSTGTTIAPRKGNPLDTIVAKGLPKAPPALKVDPNLGKAQSVDAKVVTTSNRQQTASELIAYVGKLGGRAHTLTEPGQGGKTDIRGVQATLPDKSVDQLLKYASSIGASLVDKSTTSEGTGERSQRLVQEAESRLASLKKLREALLVTYLEDAQPVKDVDAEIAEAQKAVAEAKDGKASDKMAVVKFAFVGK